MINTKEANQRVFDAALGHIRQQGEQCYDEDQHDCAYRRDGQMCAFGPCIEKYNERMEGYGAKDLYNRGSKENLYEWARDCDPKLASKIQFCHDIWLDKMDISFIDFFENGMLELAKEYNLEYKRAE